MSTPAPALEVLRSKYANEQKPEPTIYWKRSTRKMMAPNHATPTEAPWQRGAQFNTSNPQSPASVLESFLEQKLLQPLQESLMPAPEAPAEKKPKVPKRIRKQADAMQYTQADVEKLILDPRQFKKLQRSLRNRGAVTNELLKQNLSLVVQQAKKEQSKKVSRSVTN